MNAPAPGSAEWLRIVTASKVAAIIGVSPYESPFSMWQRMKGNLPPVETNDAMRRGNYLEQGVIEWWADRHQHDIDGGVAQQFYATRADLPWAAATLDGITSFDHDTIILEVKTASRMDDWGAPGTDEIPSHYLTQVYWQLAMRPDAVRAYVAVLGPFLEFSEYVVERDEAIQADLIERCRVFYESLAGDVPPDLDDTTATFECVKALHPEIERGESVDLVPVLAFEYLESVAAEKKATARARGNKSVVLDAVGRAQYITANGIRIARRQPNRGGVSLIPIASVNDLVGD